MKLKKTIFVVFILSKCKVEVYSEKTFKKYSQKKEKLSKRI